ncbi:MAG: class IIb bacteriocin, lactobin A/cerein 7B family [Gemmatimonadaceae bacterium]|nr:class IIb bacteriocin, lactobin A/cerein 7B family [Gemmatimonadaceae bacterium]
MSHATTARTIASNPVLAQKASEQFQALLARSATDMEFRRLLITDSRAALAQFTGGASSGTANIVFVENRADATIVLPDPVDPAAELNESELETVAGGITPTVILASLGAAAASALTGQLIGQAIHEFSH